MGSLRWIGANDFEKGRLFVLFIFMPGALIGLGLFTATRELRALGLRGDAGIEPRPTLPSPYAERMTPLYPAYIGALEGVENAFKNVLNAHHSRLTKELTNKIAESLGDRNLEVDADNGFIAIPPSSSITVIVVHPHASPFPRGQLLEIPAFEHRRSGSGSVTLFCFAVCHESDLERPEPDLPVSGLLLVDADQVVAIRQPSSIHHVLGSTVAWDDLEACASVIPLQDLPQALPALIRSLDS